MAHIEKRVGKLGVSYRIIVSGGFDCDGNRIIHKKTWRPPANMSERQAEKAANKEAVLFEQSIMQGYAADNKQTFAEYAEYVLQLKERIGKKHRTIEGYQRLLPRINAAIGHMPLQDIRPVHLNRFYQTLAEETAKIEEQRAVPIIDLRAVLKTKGFSMMKAAKIAGVAQSTVNSACDGNAILADRAQLICKATGIAYDEAFALRIKQKQLSTTTVLAYHRFIHTVLAQAEKEMICPYNAASKAEAPKKKRSTVDTYQTDELIRIRQAADKEPIKWQLAVHLLMITGCRRGEIVGLKWPKVNWEDSSITIDCALTYTPDRGVYESTTKTEDVRIIKLPKETMDLLRDYRRWQLEMRLAMGDLWHASEYVLTSEKGGPMSPDTLSSFLRKFERRHDLPHIHAHKFRHSMASILYYSGADPVSISKRLGHAQVSTTQDMYSHLIRQADTQSAERIADAIFRSKKD
jgi:integrase